MLLADLAADERLSAQMLARFHREGEAAARLNHRNIAIVHDVGEHSEVRDDGIERSHPFLVLEYLDGRDLKTVLQSHPGGLPVQEVLEYGLQVCDGLAAAHAAGIVHRDIKPANLMVSDDGTVKICDFGIARLQDGTAGLTRDGFQPGTLAYMAPEQLGGRQVDHRTDLYALGATLYHLLTGQTVFPADDLRALVAMHMAKTPVPPSAHRPAIPRHVDSAITVLLAKDPAQRFTSASEAASGLKTAPTTRSPHLAEAARIALSITDPFEQLSALTKVVGLVAVHDPVEAVGIAHSVVDSVNRMWALEKVAEVVAVHDLDGAERIARSITDPDKQALALRSVAEVVAERDPAKARTLLGEAERIAHSLADAEDQVRVLTAIARVMAVQDPVVARTLLSQAERIACSLADPEDQSRALVGVASAVAEHDPADAERIACSITDPIELAFALTMIAKVVAEHDPADAERIACSITDPFDLAWVLRDLAEVVAEQDPARAEQLVRTLPDPYEQAWALHDIAKVAAKRDPAVARTLLAGAERAARSLTDPDQQARVLVAVAGAMAVHDRADAERFARSLAEPDDQARALVSVAGAVAERDPAGARALLAQARGIARSLAEPDEQAGVRAGNDRKGDGRARSRRRSSAAGPGRTHRTLPNRPRHTGAGVERCRKGSGRRLRGVTGRGQKRAASVVVSGASPGGGAGLAGRCWCSRPAGR
ncbi:hypothetical protein ACTIVE_0348 [Actinomadura verrucosospora]|uniref:non-specific serine/threonine protein kinase n=1 Tax=Actinomadura verrucosospora TaxID=46165 RepID=A0A7D3VR54_ACTVE|nr:hypothetical protein ACTIVE_0348 [Actinomadura verrucosospora]